MCKSQKTKRQKQSMHTPWSGWNNDAPEEIATLQHWIQEFKNK